MTYLWLQQELLQAIEAYTNHVCSLRIHGHHVLEGTSYRVIPGAAPVVNGQGMLIQLPSA